MDKFGKSQPIRRLEDVRFLSGAGRYVDDIAPKGALHGYVLRSEVAHGTLAPLDVNDAEAMPGVALVLTAETLEAAEPTLDFSVIENTDGTEAVAPERPILARGKVRFVGEPVAFVVAETLAQARDAAEAISVEIDDLPAHVEVAPGGEPLYDEAPDNVCFDWSIGDESATRSALDGAAHVVEAEVVDNRVVANSLEPRGAYAEVEGERIHLCVNGQGVWGMVGDVARLLGIDKADVRVTNPDVGGGFGMKAMNYPENMLLCVAARRLGKPVRWMGERTESMLSDNAGRDLVTRARMGFDADHKLVAYEVDTISNLGAQVSGYAQFIQSELFAKVLTGTYDVQAVHQRCRGVFTNTVPVDAYRGAGRPEAIFVLERMMDVAARELGVDPWELRKKSFIQEFPYKTATGETYDVGDFPRLLARVEREADRAGLEARREDAASRGKMLGHGLCYYIESILGQASEHARVVFREDGMVELHVGTQSNGQGHETVMPAFLSDQTGIPLERIVFVQGDSDLIPAGGGTGGSRSVTTQNNATLATSQRIIEDFSAFLAEAEGVDAADVSFDDERFRIEGSNTAPDMLEAAQIIREAGRVELLDQRHKAELPGRSYPNGAHVAEVEIDPETGHMAVTRYTVVDDFGNLINPLLAEGQVHGGVAQGIGQAVSEHCAYDADGQCLTATFMDYGMPRATDMPWVVFHSEPVPSTANVLGMKGCGEAGTVGALAAVANAVADVFAQAGAEPPAMPYTPVRVWEALSGEMKVAAE